MLCLRVSGVEGFLGLSAQRFLGSVFDVWVLLFRRNSKSCTCCEGSKFSIVLGLRAFRVFGCWGFGLEFRV